MTTLGHTSVGIATGKILLLMYPELKVIEMGFIAMCVAISNLPDINLLWKKKLLKHHDDFTHYPIFGLICSLSILLVEIILKADNHILSITFTTLIFLHYIMDTFGYAIGIHWLYPYSKKQFSITKLKTPAKNIRQKLSGGIKSQAAFAEMFVHSLSLFIIFYL